MRSLFRRLPTLLCAVGALSVAACRDAVAPTPARHAPGSPTDIIVDGAHNGGNKDVFFLPPLVPPPARSAGFGDPFQPGLPVSFRIIDLNDGNKLVKEFPADVVRMSDLLDDYHVLWDTRKPDLNPAHTYRLQVWIGKEMVAYADVDVVTTLKQLFNVNTKEYIPLLDDFFFLIRVRVEKGWNCQNKLSCATKVVPNVAPDGSGSTLVEMDNKVAAGRFYDGWIRYCTAAGQTGCVPPGTNVVVTIEDATEQLKAQGTDCSLRKGEGPPRTLMVSGHCVKFTTDPEFTFAHYVDIGVCTERLGDNLQLLKYDVDEPPRFLENVPFNGSNGLPFPKQCPEVIGAAPAAFNGFFGFASNTLSRFGRAVSRFVGPKPLYAIDLGVGGRIDEGGGFSYVTVAEPATIIKSDGDLQSAVVNSFVSTPPRFQVITVHDGAVAIANRDVVCSTSGGASVGTAGATSITVQTNSDGFAECPFKLGGTAGSYTMTARAAGIDDGAIAVEGVPGEPYEVTLHAVVTFTATATPALGDPRNLIDCPVPSLEAGGDQTFRGFYVPNYPGVNLRQVNMWFSSEDHPGNYTFSLTARRATYDGTVIGTSTTTATLVGGGGTSLTPATFTFDSPTVAQGSTVTFAVSVVSKPEGAGVAFYAAQTTNTSCPVIQTEDTAAPLSSFRRNGVAVQIIGNAP